MTENKYFAVANTLSPLTSSLANSSLQDADPVLYRLIQFFAGVIAIHVGPRFDAEVTAMGRPDLVGKSVAQVIPYDPLPISQEDTYQFPLLCAYRKSEAYQYKTITWYSIKSDIEVLYILPPLTSDQGKRLYPLLTHVGRTFVDRTLEGSDSGFNAGEQVWHEAGLDQIGMDRTDYGKFPSLKPGSNQNSNIWFPGISCSVECLERRMPASQNFSPFAGFDGYVSQDPNDGNPPFDIVDVLKNF